MAKPRTANVHRTIRTLYSVGTIRELSDGQLLERFVTERGEGAELAFAVLVERHGPMVLRVCHGVLSNWHDTEDAFQATFLVLVKKARALWVKDSLGPWLHQVAVRTARSARIAAARRHRCEENAAAIAIEERAPRGDDVNQMLHDEIEKLPERFRLPLVLCDLEQCTHQQAARHLGWPIGTVKSRLARGRERLRQSLTRRGVASSAELIIAASPPDSSLAIRLPALIDSTARAAVQFASTRAIAVGSIATLTHAALRTTFIAQWLRAGTIALAFGTAGAGAGWLLNQAAPEQDSPRAGDREGTGRSDPASTTVRPGRLHTVVSEPGLVVHANTHYAICTVEGQSVINWILPDRSVVKKGDLVCQLDQGNLRAHLKSQSDDVKVAQANYLAAKEAAKIAELAFVEYTEGIAVSDQTRLRQSVNSASSALAKTENRLGRTLQASKLIGEAIARVKGKPTPADILARLDIEERLEAAQEESEAKKTTLAQAKSKLEQFESTTRPASIKALKVELDRLRANERASKAAWDAEKAKEENLNRQLKDFDLHAPADGLILHANPTGAFQNRIAIANGATVRERQIIFTMPDVTSPLRVKTHVPESSIAHLAPGSKVRILPGGGPDRGLTGKISDIAARPDPTSFFDPRRLRTITIRVDDPPPELVFDMKVRVVLDVANLDDVLTVPAKAVMTLEGKDKVAVKTPSGGFEWREVTLGLSDGASVEVKKGIQSGEQVILEPKTVAPAKQSITD